MSKARTHRRPWPPPAANLPETIEQIEAGRDRPTTPLDNSKAARLARLLGTVPGVATADGMPTTSRRSIRR